MKRGGEAMRAASKTMNEEETKMAALDDLMNKARELADLVGKATEELVDDSRIKIQELKLSSELKDAYERLGSVIYDSIKSGEENQALVDLVVGEIDTIHQGLEALKVKAAPAPAERYCAQCGATNGGESSFCSRCGAPLSIPEEAPEAEAPAVTEAEDAGE